MAGPVAGLVEHPGMQLKTIQAVLMALLIRSFLFFIPALLLLACSEAEIEPVELTRVQAIIQDPMELERGRALFTGSCAGLCHALTRDDTTDASYLFDCEWNHGDTDDEIFATLTRGIQDTRMVGFGDNFPEGDDDKWRIIAFLRANQQTCE